MNNSIARISAYLSTCATSADFKPMAIAPVLPNVFIIELERTAPALKPKLRVKLIGTALEKAFGRPLVGEYLESFIHGPRGNEVIKGFYDCAATREPLWMRQVMKMKEGGARFVEGVLHYLVPERIYGGLAMGEWTHTDESSFERRAIAIATTR
jgi:hypothetical protein